MVALILTQEERQHGMKTTTERTAYGDELDEEVPEETEKEVHVELTTLSRLNVPPPVLFIQRV